VCLGLEQGTGRRAGGHEENLSSLVERGCHSGGQKNETISDNLLNNTKLSCKL